ncbi:hypothetical protein FA13DRAFT_1293329 [Coprinellus micaceus]|uniref:Uncharacterized protein n=1 Tax=Coprinellus micaceus TaxID=71717 RepID=A0A4Y7SS46_COPMI|nr:hypothetical protein FA13DRAFT_1293329 [Coprinellus micaceus]
MVVRSHSQNSNLRRPRESNSNCTDLDLEYTRVDGGVSRTSSKRCPLLEGFSKVRCRVWQWGCAAWRALEASSFGCDLRGSENTLGKRRSQVRLAKPSSWLESGHHRATSIDVVSSTLLATLSFGSVGILDEMGPALPLASNADRILDALMGGWSNPPDLKGFAESSEEFTQLRKLKAKCTAFEGRRDQLIK